MVRRIISVVTFDISEIAGSSEPCAAPSDHTGVIREVL